MKTLYNYTSADETRYLIVVVEARKVSFKWEEAVISLRKTQGARYLVELLLHPYQSISAEALYALCNLEPARYNGSDAAEMELSPADHVFHSILPVGDVKAMTQVKQRLNLLTVQIAEAEEWHDIARLEELKLERDTLLDYLKDSIAKGRTETVCRETTSKCTDSVYHALDYLLQVLAKEHPVLGNLLRKSLRLWGNLLFIPPDELSVIVMEQ